MQNKCIEVCVKDFLNHIFPWSKILFAKHIKVYFIYKPIHFKIGGNKYMTENVSPIKVLKHVVMNSMLQITKLLFLLRTLYSVPKFMFRIVSLVG